MMQIFPKKKYSPIDHREEKHQWNKHIVDNLFSPIRKVCHFVMRIANNTIEYCEEQKPKKHSNKSENKHD